MKEDFHDKKERIVFSEIKKFILAYNGLPTEKSLSISLSDRKDLTNDEFNDTVKLIETLKTKESNMDWLVESTEKFCKDKAVYNAIMESIHIIDGKSKEKTENAIPEILSDALSVSFDAHIGHDYFADADADSVLS